jgi:outer membrane PBP1 activator LpoA protein
MLHVRRHRPQAAAILALLLVLAAALVLPLEPAWGARRDDIAAADAAALAGRHAEAAAMYEQLADRRFFGLDERLALLAAGEYLAAGRLDDAERIIDMVGDRRLKDDEAILYARVRAEIALARKNPEEALAALDAAPGPLPPAVATEFADLRQRAEAMARPQAPAATASPLPPSAAAGPPPVTSMERVELLPQGSVTKVGLMLPLSGRLEPFSRAVQDGFIAAWLTEPVDFRPEVVVYDTDAGGVGAAFERALADQVQFVVGPLGKENVAALAARSDIYVPVLALNSYAGEYPPPFLYRYSLDPEEEARAVARRIAADGRQHGIALVPSGNWGQRVYEAFMTEAQASGLVITSTQFYDPGAQDFSGPLRAALGRFGGAGDRREGKPAPKRDAAAEQRDGPQFAFIAASAVTARAIKPQLRFQMSYALPVYATSDAWDPGAHGVHDMDGMVYPEMPWILYGGQGAPELWRIVQEQWAVRSRGVQRLYAFGFDAYQLMRSLRGSGRVFGYNGLTGVLDVGADGQVRRQTDFARVVNGVAEPAGFALFTPASEP